MEYEVYRDITENGVHYTVFTNHNNGSLHTQDVFLGDEDEFKRILAEYKAAGEKIMECDWRE